MVGIPFSPMTLWARVPRVSVCKKRKAATYSDPHLPNEDSQSTFGITVHIKLRPSGKLKRVVYSLFYKGLLPFSHFASNLVGDGKCLTTI